MKIKHTPIGTDVAIQSVADSRSKKILHMALLTVQVCRVMTLQVQVFN